VLLMMGQYKRSVSVINQLLAILRSHVGEEVC
jgi:hypothetical protein